jgi:hypothetical protein
MSLGDRFVSKDYTDYADFDLNIDRLVGFCRLTRGTCVCLAQQRFANRDGLIRYRSRRVGEYHGKKCV